MFKEKNVKYIFDLYNMQKIIQIKFNSIILESYSILGDPDEEKIYYILYQKVC